MVEQNCFRKTGLWPFQTLTKKQIPTENKIEKQRLTFLSLWDKITWDYKI